MDYERVDYFNRILENNDYRLFRENYRKIGETLDETNVSKVKIEDLWKKIDGNGLKGLEIRKIMEIYTETGIVTREYDNFSKEPVYNVPDYSGKFGDSWNDILDRLESEMIEAEKKACRSKEEQESYHLDQLF